ncbi:hypothetical protein AB0I10_32775 [Streptomyces sp. NPDC050636]|uniref:hypothetical protein n=1 Tax=Streptomyces sp. NPDC050636 TaxID=3154510 RepID=UPI003424460E
MGGFAESVRERASAARDAVGAAQAADDLSGSSSATAGTLGIDADAVPRAESRTEPESGAPA